MANSTFLASRAALLNGGGPSPIRSTRNELRIRHPAADTLSAGRQATDRVGGPDAQAFRLGKINEVEVFLRTEIAERERLAKKRARGAAICDAVAGGATAASAVAGIGGIGLLSTIIAAPVVIGLEVGSLALAGVGIALQACSRVARRKADKHDRIAILARSKLDSVADVVSKALADGHVDNAEFSLVVAELDRYRALKDEIRRSALQALPNGGIDPAATEAALRERLREELAAELRDKITASTATLFSTVSSSK